MKKSLFGINRQKITGILSILIFVISGVTSFAIYAASSLFFRTILFLASNSDFRRGSTKV